jgi:hypothetical protein
MVFMWQNQYEQLRQSLEDARAHARLFRARRAIPIADDELNNAPIVTLELKSRSRTP